MCTKHNKMSLCVYLSNKNLNCFYRCYIIFLVANTNDIVPYKNSFKVITMQISIFSATYFPIVSSVYYNRIFSYFIVVFHLFFCFMFNECLYISATTCSLFVRNSVSNSVIECSKTVLCTLNISNNCK